MSYRVLSQRVKGGRGKSTRRAIENEENIPIDLELNPKENLKTILSNVCCTQTSVSNGRQLGHLNNLVKLLCTRDDVLEHISLSTLLICLKPALVNDVKEVRAACIRVLRYLINDSESCKSLVDHHVDYLVVKCLDISHFNEVERIQTLRLIRKIIHVMKCEKNLKNAIPRSLISCIISISSDGADERDRVYRTCLGVLCELAITHPNLCVQYGGLLSLFRSIPECHLYPRICECVIMSIVHVINSLDSCNVSIALNMDPLFSSYTDLLVRRSRSNSDDNQIREDEMHFVACKTAIVSALRSWSGLTYMCQGNGLISFISALSVPNSITIRGILSVLFELFYMPEPEWTDDFNIALKTANPSVFQESWRLSNSFIASEAKALLPLRCKTRVDILDTFTSVLLAVFLNRGLLDHLLQCAISTDTHASVSSCMLLGGILHLCGELLPQTGSLYDKENKISMHRECLPKLLKRATDATTTKEEKSAAVIAASRLEEIKKIYNKNSVSYSLYLEELLFRSLNYTSETEDIVFLDDPMTIASSQISRMPSSSISRRSSTIHSGGGSISESGEVAIHVHTSARKSRSISLIRDFAEDRILAKIKDTQVLLTKENKQWKWNAILSILNNTYENNMSKEYLYGISNNDSVHRFFKRLVYFYLPKSKLFSVLELAREGMHDHNRDLVLAGCRLMRFLLKANSLESLTLLTSLVAQIVEHLTNEASSTGGYKKTGEFAIGTTCSRDYFLLLGAISSDEIGDKVLESQNAYTYFNSLLTETTHENVIKLLLSSLQYSEYGEAREILRSALKKCSERCRLYATSFLRCLYRADVIDFIQWGTELLSSQLQDSSNAVAMEALNILDELCDDPEYLKAVVNLAPSVLHMGERGAMLVCRFLAYPTKSSYLSDGTYLAKELERWWLSARAKYVEQVEQMLHVSLTSYEKPTNGNVYVRRSNVKKPKCPVRLPAHLYGELAKYTSGCVVLQKQCIVLKLVNLLNKEMNELKKLMQNSETICYQTNRKINNRLLEIKSCVWGLAHISSTNEGFTLTKQYDVCKILVNLAEKSQFYSLRGTCTYCLSLVAQTVKGVEQLATHNWLCVTQKAKRLSEWTDEPSPDEVINCHYSPAAFVRRTSSVKQLERSPVLTKQLSVSTECVFTIGENKEKMEIEEQQNSLLPILSNKDPDLTPSNSVLTLKDQEKNTSFYGSRNLSFTHDNDQNNKNGKSKKMESNGSSNNLLASLNTGITAMYNIREKFQKRSSSFSENLTNKMESIDAKDPVELSVENITLAKYVGLALPCNIFSLFTLNHTTSVENNVAQSPLPHDELPFLIRNAMHKKHSDSKFLVISDNPDIKSYNDTPYIDDLQKSPDNQKAIQEEVLKLVAKLGSSIGVRSHETALLTIKEKVPEVFDSVSTYNQVSEMLALYNYRLTARRFIQELFHGMQMEELYVEAKLELDKYSQYDTL